uniref:Uncharacterized protein n=1 Tax=Brugia malayi TaxID=6279 RepID=A8PV33_BRUMA
MLNECVQNLHIRGVGSTAYLKCHLYHNLYGNNVTTCSFDGIWRPKLGVCKLKPQYDGNFCKPYGSDRQPLLKYSTVKPFPSIIVAPLSVNFNLSLSSILSSMKHFL